ncbi:MAG TPA: FtsX-like permease family protein [Thermoanaerobaculia bacterium]|jgi:putative ABC transport system permease protein|nr:FtsX-like permease family protein [Thermoanaerobaculia bacterium]
MVPLARRLLLRNRGGLLVTIAGVAATVSLLLFLFAVHAGVKDGSTRYVRTANVDVWIAQKGSDNIIKSSSFVPASLAKRVAAIEGVEAASPLVRVISKAEIGGRLTSTLFLFGFDPQTRLGAPDGVRLQPGEIVLDESFARKYELDAGDTLTIQRRPFRIVRLSQGTNALLSQFGFLRFEDAAAILGLHDTASFILVRGKGTAERIRRALPDVAVHESADFVRYHDEELDAGVLPVFFALAAFGAAVGGLIIALMLYSSALERRDDYATLKALGAGHRYLLRLVLAQSLLVTIAGSVAGALFTLAITPLLLRAIPTLVLLYLPRHAILFPVALAIGALAGVAPLRVLRRIYPGEVFRA